MIARLMGSEPLPVHSEPDFEISSTTGGWGDTNDFSIIDFSGTDDSSTNEASISLDVHETSNDLPNVLMDPSEDPYLNEGNTLFPQAGRLQMDFNHFATDELEGINKWMEVGDP